MLTTSRFSLKKPQTTDAPSVLRTAIFDNATVLDLLPDARGYNEVLGSRSLTPAATAAEDPSTPGPSVTLTVATSGLVEVRAQVQAAGSNTVGVWLAEDGTALQQIMSIATGVIGSTPVARTVPGSATGILTAAASRQCLGGWLAIDGASAGSHTYKLMFASTPGNSAISILNCKLWVRSPTN